MPHPWSKGRRRGLRRHLLAYAVLGPLVGLGWMAAIAFATGGGFNAVLALGLAALVLGAPPSLIAGLVTWPLRRRPSRYLLNATGSAAVVAFLYVAVAFRGWLFQDAGGPPTWFRILIVVLMGAVGGLASAVATRRPPPVEPSVAEVFE